METEAAAVVAEATAVEIRETKGLGATRTVGAIPKTTTAAVSAVATAEVVGCKEARTTHHQEYAKITTSMENKHGTV